MKFSRKTQETIACAFFFIFVPILAHLSFSWMGFCPTDDGWILAFSRRLLDGQVPHRDFIAMRPIGTPVFHLPFLLFGGNYTLWTSRFFIWFQFACIAWIWTVVILKSLKIRLTVLEKFILALIAFMLTSHIFPVMPFPTIDGLFFLSLGLVLYTKRTPHNKWLAYILMGIAYLCKQSFLPMILVFLIVLGDWRRPRFWLAAAIPGVIYCTYLLFTRALPDAILQLTAHADLFFSRGIKMYALECAVFWGILLGCFAMVLLFEQIKIGGLEKKIGLQRLLGALMLYGMPLGYSVALSQNIPAARFLCFSLFGTAVGATGYFALKGKEWALFTRIGALVLVMGWSVSLSLGYPNPAFSMGAVTVLLIAYCHAAYQSVDKKNTARELPFYLLIVLFIVTIFSYGIARQKYIYEDRPARELTKALGDVLPGGYLIKTNTNTYQFLVDFKEAIEKTKGQDFAVIPGLPAYWAKSLKKNPLPFDWVLMSELAYKRELIDRVLRNLHNRQGTVIVILEKVGADHIANGFTPLRSGEIQRYIRDHFTKMDETKFFELYQ